MSRYHSYLNTSSEIIRLYAGDQPLAVFLKRYFAADKKFGSKDRKQISHLCYCYYRTGKMFAQKGVANDSTIQQRIRAGLFLCSTSPNEIIQHLLTEWVPFLHLSAEQKCEIIDRELNAAKPFTTNHPAPFTAHCSPDIVFPWVEGLSNGIDPSRFCRSFFAQPDLFVRIRPGYQASVEEKLRRSEIPFRYINEFCIAFPNNTKLEAVVALNKEAVIQDYSSQRVAEFLQPLVSNKRLEVWDCCAASGGKSILAKDILQNIALTVSDIRESILINLKKRFAAAGINEYTTQIADLASSSNTQRKSTTQHAGNHPPFAIRHSFFDLIICDAPCSGSGTWARTPEQLYFWKEEHLLRYTGVQKKILATIVSSLKPGGHLLYITCSVFRDENETMVNECVTQHHLELVKMEMLMGYDNKADNLFAALMFKPW